MNFLNPRNVIRNQIGGDTIIFKKLMQAIDAIPEFYYDVFQPEIRNGYKVNEAEERSFYERRFAMVLFAELYDAIKNESSYNFNLDTEIRKRFDYQKNRFNSVELKKIKFTKQELKDNKKKFSDFFPDIIVHRSQDKNNTDNQVLAMEIKGPEVSSKDFFWDYFKLNIYIDEFNYQKTVYLLINEDWEKIQRFLQEYIQNQYYTSKYSDRIEYILKKRGYNCEKKTLKELL